MASAHALMKLPIKMKAKPVLKQAHDLCAVEFVENPGIAGRDVLRTQLERELAAKNMTNVKVAAGTDIKQKNAVIGT